MSKKRVPARANAVSRRQVLESLGALAAVTACGGTNEEPPADPGSGGAGAAGVSGSSSGAGLGGNAGVGGSAGTGAGKGGATSGGGGGTGPNGGSSGSGVNAGAGSGGAPTAGTAGESGSAGTQATAGTGGNGAAGGSAGNAGAGGTAGGSGGVSGGGSGGVAGSGGSGGLTPPPFDDVPMCTMSPTDGAGQGPFFVHDQESAEDESLFRQDIRGRYNESAAAGVEMNLHLRVLDSTSSDCNGTPVPDVDVYIWHTDAQGYYSGFGTRGTANEQKPDQTYSGAPNQNDLDTEERFCRGVQTTNADGVVSFKSVFPGWYNGRDVHIHVVVLKKDSASRGRVSYTKQNTQNQWLFTTQFYFEPDFTASVHEQYEPYKARTTGSLATAYEGAIRADEGGNSGLRAKASLAGEVVTAQMQLVINPA
jgi:protocatechuate 3,4-dioxygenase beta subunit